MKNNLVVCINKGNWYHHVTREKLIGPRYNETVTVIDFNIVDGVVYFILDEYVSHDGIGWVARCFTKLINIDDDLRSVIEYETTNYNPRQHLKP